MNNDFYDLSLKFSKDVILIYIFDTYKLTVQTSLTFKQFKESVDYNTYKTFVDLFLKFIKKTLLGVNAFKDFHSGICKAIDEMDTTDDYVVMLDSSVDDSNTLEITFAFRDKEDKEEVIADNE